jgi:uncharacterized protein YjbI with pentapeptide repeats
MSTDPVNPISEEEIREKLRLHQEWLESDGTRGKQGDFSHQTFPEKYDLSSQNLTKAKCFNTTFINVNLSYAKLINAELIHTTLNNANLSGADLTGANLKYAKLVEAKLLLSTDLSNTTLDYADLTRAKLLGANLSGATIRETNFTDADLRHTSGLHLNSTFIRNARFLAVGLCFWAFICNHCFPWLRKWFEKRS